MIVDHGESANQNFGDPWTTLDPREEEWGKITKTLPDTCRSIVLCGCHVARGVRGEEYLLDLSKYSRRPGVTVSAFTGPVAYALRSGYGTYVSKRFY